MTARSDHRGYAWMERRHGTLDDVAPLAEIERLRDLPGEVLERPPVAEELRRMLPSDRDASRRVRSAIPSSWRSALDAALRGEAIAPPLLARLDAVVRAHVNTPSGSRLVFDQTVDSADELHALATQIGYAAFGAASTELDGRRAVRLRRSVGAEFGPAFEFGRTSSETFASFALDAFVRLSSTYDDLAERAQALGMLLVAVDLADQSDARIEAIAALLRGRNRNEFHEFVALARRSSRRDRFGDFRIFLKELLSE